MNNSLPKNLPKINNLNNSDYIDKINNILIKLNNKKIYIDSYATVTTPVCVDIIVSQVQPHAQTQMDSTANHLVLK